jgi:hypothetical protein
MAGERDGTSSQSIAEYDGIEIGHEEVPQRHCCLPLAKRFCGLSDCDQRDMSKLFQKTVRSDVLRKSFSRSREGSDETQHRTNLVAETLFSDLDIVQSLVRDDVVAFSIWAIDHVDLVINFVGHAESALTVGCAANATNCVNSILLRGTVPNGRTLEAAVQTRVPALIRKIANTIQATTEYFAAYRMALLQEDLNVADFLGRKSPEIQSWRDALLKCLPSHDISIASAFAERRGLEMDKGVVVISKTNFPEESVVTNAILDRAFARRSWDYVKRLVVVGEWTEWRTNLPRGHYQSKWFEIVDLSGASLSSIGARSFLWREAIRAVHFGEGLMQYEQGALSGCKSLEEIIIPDTVVEIAMGAFSDCKSLKVVKFGRSLQSIGESAFGGCGTLSEIILPDSLQELGPCAFCECFSLKLVKIGKGLTRLGGLAFAQCACLVDLAFPSPLESVGVVPFYMCKSLKSLVLQVGSPDVDYGCPSDTRVKFLK